MNKVARWNARDRADLFTAAAAKRGFPSHIMEKDFWVCWTLRQLFGMSAPPAGMLFKGGTSLSKVYRAIARFSEDIDLSFDRVALGFTGDRDPGAQPTNKRREALLDELAATCRDMIRERLLPQLTTLFGEVLGTEAGSTWSLDVDPDDGQTLLFQYPRISAGAGAAVYVDPVVRMEFGARGEQWPAEEREVTPYAAEESADNFEEASCRVRVLAAERTFWEKATILHYWYHAPARKAFGDRQSRHYYDLAQMFEGDIGNRALADMSLLTAVAEHKNIYFHVAWARYGDAKPGSLRLVPPSERAAALEADYTKMSEMLFPGMTHPSFDDVMKTLQDLECRINGS